MSENYIVINGKKAEFTEEQLEKLDIKSENKNNYEKMFDEPRIFGYYVGNYCKDDVVMKQRMLHETLNRLLWQASVEAGEPDNEWMGYGYEHKHWHIEMYTNTEEFGVDYFMDTKYCDGIYFPTKQSALDAIENIVKPFMEEHPDFEW